LADPRDHGIRDAGRRRVHGLRREELAFLAGVSAPYYARLEQGRDRSPSIEVLDAIGRVLGLDDEALEYLRGLSIPSSPRRRRGARPERVSPLLSQMLENLVLQPALVIGRHRDVLASNTLAVALNPGFAVGRNLVRDTFLEPATRRLYAEWSSVAADAVAALRASIGTAVDDPAVQALVGELAMKSSEFRQLWDRYDVRSKSSGLKHYRHPMVGELHLDYQTFAVNGTDGMTLHVFSAAPDTPAHDALALLDHHMGELEKAAPKSPKVQSSAAD